jgi:3-deoxy-D-arabino-heptulosonate 7-phosphate (DAHP) synthase
MLPLKKNSYEAKGYGVIQDKHHHLHKKMISDTTSMEEGKAGELTIAIEKLRSYASESHHVVDSQGKVKEVYTGGKEDAYMAYMLAASVTNLLAKKFSNIVSSS